MSDEYGAGYIPPSWQKFRDSAVPWPVHGSEDLHASSISGSLVAIYHTLETDLAICCAAVPHVLGEHDKLGWRPVERYG